MLALELSTREEDIHFNLEGYGRFIVSQEHKDALYKLASFKVKLVSFKYVLIFKGI